MVANTTVFGAKEGSCVDLLDSNQALKVGKVPDTDKTPTPGMPPRRSQTTTQPSKKSRSWIMVPSSGSRTTDAPLLQL